MMKYKFGKMLYKSCEEPTPLHFSLCFTGLDLVDMQPRDLMFVCLINYRYSQLLNKTLKQQ